MQREVPIPDTSSQNEWPTVAINRKATQHRPAAEDPTSTPKEKDYNFMKAVVRSLDMARVR